MSGARNSAQGESESLLIHLLYLFVRAAAFPLLVLYFLYRGYRDPRYFRRFMERLGSVRAAYKRTAPGCIWLHAVSVGEVISAVQLVAGLRAANPAIPIYLSTTTLAGRATAEQKVAGVVDGVFFAPIDYSFAIRRVLRRIRPAVLVVLETEIWPNLYREVKLAGCGLLIVNGRISGRALPKYQRFRWFFRAALAHADRIFVQSEADRARYAAIGAPQDRVSVLGNLKYDAPDPQAPAQAVVDLLARAKPAAIWIAASTMPPDEDAAVLDAFANLAAKDPRLMLVLAPRKPEMFDSAAALLERRGIPFVRRSSLDETSELQLPGVLLLDTIGELAGLFPLCDVVFMGGTLAPRGGHNILEPAFAARPVIIGPHMDNFAAIAEEFRARGAVVEIASPAELAGAVGRLLSDPALRSDLGRRAHEIAASKRGVTARAVDEILKAQDYAVPAWKLRGFWKSVAGALSLIWKWAGAIKQRRDIKTMRCLATPVISAGGIAMGGCGKTPFVLLLARLLRERGVRPGILTRGYRRRSVADLIVVEAGAYASTPITGDEAQMFVRSGLADVGISSNRWLAGRAIEHGAGVDVFLLDDGFQHRRLKRDLDFVLLDALDPFAGGALFPRGRLREPVEALARAGAFVITRAQPGRQYRGLRDRLQHLNAAAPVFCATVEPSRWIRGATGEECAQPAGPLAAFCGLGNPNSFWETLRHLGIEPSPSWTFGDHHVYKPLDLRRLASLARSAGCAALITTEKDAMNLPQDFAALIAPIELYWLEVELHIDREDDLLGLIEAASPARLHLRVSR